MTVSAKNLTANLSPAMSGNYIQLLYTGLKRFTVSTCSNLSPAISGNYSQLLYTGLKRFTVSTCSNLSPAISGNYSQLLYTGLKRFTVSTCSNLSPAILGNYSQLLYTGLKRFTVSTCSNLCPKPHLKQRARVARQKSDQIMITLSYNTSTNNRPRGLQTSQHLISLDTQRAHKIFKIKPAT